jgi:hypothetical protein
MTLTTATERVTELGKKRDDALRRIEDNRKRRPDGERDNPYYDDCIDAVWGLYYANIKRLAT